MLVRCNIKKHISVWARIISRYAVCVLKVPAAAVSRATKLTVRAASRAGSWLPGTELPKETGLPGKPLSIAESRLKATTRCSYRASCGKQSIKVWRVSAGDFGFDPLKLGENS